MHYLRILFQWAHLALVVALAGCHLVLSYDERALEPGAGDAAVRDAAGQDRGSASDAMDDRLSPDAPPPQDARRPVDAPADHVPALDAAIPDSASAPLDSASAPLDSASAPPDALPLLDSLQPDSPLSGGDPCVSGTARYTPFNLPDQIAFCLLPAGSQINQCAAVAECNAAEGWSLCPASTYKALVQNLAFDYIDFAWIGGCIRDGGDPHAPVDGPCGSCGSAPLPSFEQVAWGCTSGSISSDQQYVGLLAHHACYAVGLQDVSTQSRWRPRDASDTSSSVVCCKP